MRPSSSAGAATSSRKTAPTISSKSRLLTSSRRFSVPLLRQVLVRVEGLLRRGQGLRHVLKVDAHAGPGTMAGAKRGDEHAGGGGVRRGGGGSSPPPPGA